MFIGVHIHKHRHNFINCSVYWLCAKHAFSLSTFCRWIQWALEVTRCSLTMLMSERRAKVYFRMTERMRVVWPNGPYNLISTYIRLSIFKIDKHLSRAPHILILGADLN